MLASEQPINIIRAFTVDATTNGHKVIYPINCGSLTEAEMREIGDGIKAVAHVLSQLETMSGYKKMSFMGKLVNKIMTSEENTWSLEGLYQHLKKECPNVDLNPITELLQPIQIVRLLVTNDNPEINSNKIKFKNIIEFSISSDTQVEGFRNFKDLNIHDKLAVLSDLILSEYQTNRLKLPKIEKIVAELAKEKKIDYLAQIKSKSPSFFTSSVRITKNIFAACTKDAIKSTVSGICQKVFTYGSVLFLTTYMSSGGDNLMLKCGIFASLLYAASTFRDYANYCEVKLKNRFSINTRELFIKKLLSTNPTTRQSEQFNNIANGIQIHQIVNFALENVKLISSATVCVLAAAKLFQTSPVIVGLFALSAAWKFFQAKKEIRDIVKTEDTNQPTSRAFTVTVTEFMRPLTLQAVKAHGMTDIVLSKIRAQKETLNEGHFANLKKVFSNENFSALLTSVGFGSFLYLAGISSPDNILPIVTLGFGLDKQLIEIKGAFRNQMLNLVHLARFYALDSIDQSGKDLKKEIITSNPTIELKDCFYCSENGVLLLKDINLKIKHGEVVYIVGESGSGKSTLAKVIAGQLEPTYGHYTINGIDIKTIAENSLIDNISQYSQNDYLCDTLTIFENIVSKRNSNNPEDLERLKKISNILGLESFVNEDDWDKPIGSDFGGKSFSGGQRQKIAVARALFRSNNKILILDEPTSNIDGKNDKLIMNNIRQYAIDNELTLIVVTHKEAHIPKDSRILRISNSTIVE